MTGNAVNRMRESRSHGEVEQSTTQYKIRKGVGDTMRSPEIILKNLESKTKDKSYRFERLYRNLYNPEFYLLAYQKIAASEGSMTAGTKIGSALAILNLILYKIICNFKGFYSSLCQCDL